MKAALALAVLVVTLSLTPILLWIGIMVLVPFAIAIGPVVLLLATAAVPALLVSALGAGVSGRAAATPRGHLHPRMPATAH